jgi:hypothetical protein
MLTVQRVRAMDILTVGISGIYGFFGAPDAAALAIDVIISILMAASIVVAVLEATRILRESFTKEWKGTPARHEAPAPAEIIAPSAKKDIDALKPTMPESVAAMADKYGLESLTIASTDGLSVASTNKTPDEEAAVMSVLFNELHKDGSKYYHLGNRGAHLFLIDGDLFGIAAKKGLMSSDDVRDMTDDALKVMKKFEIGEKKA